MDNKKKYYSLNVQLSMAVVLGIMLSFVMYVVVSNVGDRIIFNEFLSDEAIERNVGESFESLENYIIKNDVQATEQREIAEWLKQNKHTYLYIYDNHNSYFEAGWSYESGISSGNKDMWMTEEKNEDLPRIDYDNFEEDAKNRIVSFADRDYYVFIDKYDEQVWYGVLQIITIVACFITLLATILVYNATILRRIKRFSEDVRYIAEENINAEIHNYHNDEIGKLALSVNHMRNSILEKHENEKAAWKANQELITAMSHDIRSPLTSIIGYLDIIKDQNKSEDENIDKYIDSCRDKAFQLKELSDKMFQYFLVFGKSDEETVLETYDTNLLLEQIIGEHSAELTSNGYTVEAEGQLENSTIETELTCLRRIFDNLFNNIMKYADKSKPVKIFIKEEDSRVVVEINNKIPEIRKKVESNRIGLKTCEKLCNKIKSSFSYYERENDFSVKLEFPVRR